jgi:ribonuclease HI
MSSNAPLDSESTAGTRRIREEGNDGGGDGDRGADQRRTIHVRHYLTRTATNNEAEYDGLVTALRVAKQQAQQIVSGTSVMPCDVKLIVQGDSDLIIKQLRGTYQCRHPKLVPLYRQSVRLIQDIRAVTSSRGGGTCEVVYEHVYRQYNAVADGMCSLCRSERTISPDRVSPNVFVAVP